MKTNTRLPKVLRIANSRGRNPVLRDIKKARDILQGLSIELNDSEGKRAIDTCTNLLWEILCDNEN